MFKTSDSYFHPLELEGAMDLPKRFTFPFYYSPHPICIKAVDELKAYLDIQTDFDHNFGLRSGRQGQEIGKMFGIMVVETLDGRLGYLAAFSGKLAESNHIKGFVPPVFDTLNDGGFFKKEEARLNNLTSEIERLEQNPALHHIKSNLEDQKIENTRILDAFKQQMKQNKQKRNALRNEINLAFPESEGKRIYDDLNQKSIKDKLDLKYLKLDLQKKLKAAENKRTEWLHPIKILKAERKALSSQLQHQIHKSYKFLNSNGEQKDLLSIFGATKIGAPPAAAGECAAPKLFQFAYQNQLKPIAMAEFYWGISPTAEVRKHGQFYPSCRNRCEPILGHMMQGLQVDVNPIETAGIYTGELQIIYEDKFLLVLNKPSEFLSVPGKTIKDSVLKRMQAYLPNATGPLLVHRLDMSTSGLMLVAKTKKTHKNLQKQFINRTVKKRYVAVLDGLLKKTSGTISLPLRVDINDRPRQLICNIHGKPAVTKFEVISSTSRTTRIYFYPITGRTHQLRVHAAHHLGLNTPIVGDDLYGLPSNRLHLHAEMLSFVHPVSHQSVSFSCEAPF